MFLEAQTTMVKKASKSSDSEKEVDDGGDGPLIDLANKDIKKLLQKAKERGYVTYDEINDAMPEDQISSEQIEDTMATLSEMGVNIVENEDEVEVEEDSSITKLPATTEAKDVLNTSSGQESLDRTDDPVRMYLREMGSIELLSRQGEIEIAKRIESGKKEMISGICESPLTMQAMVEWRDDLKSGDVLLREIIDLDSTYGIKPTVSSDENSSDELNANGDIKKDESENINKNDIANKDLNEDEASEESDEQSEDEETNVPLSIMEAQLLPEVIVQFDEIAKSYKKLKKLQEAKLASDASKVELSKYQEKKYIKLTKELVDLIQSVHLHNNRIEALVDQLYGLSRRIANHQRILWQLAEKHGVSRESFLENHSGEELNVSWP